MSKDKMKEYQMKDLNQRSSPSVGLLDDSDEGGHYNKTNKQGMPKFNANLLEDDPYAVQEE